MKTEMEAATDQLFIGLMSGTSIDAIDAALISFENEKITLIATHSISIPDATKSNLKKLLQNDSITLELLGETDTQLGELFSQAALQLLKKAGVEADKITAIGSHGQTIYHAPNGKHPFTLQIGDPNIIAARTSITTIADFRRRDVALGGQGAPLTPAFHYALFGRQPHDQFVVNLGGIANITHIPADQTQPILGFDTGPANTLLDQWCEKYTSRSFDDNGEWARSGKLIPELLSVLLADNYFKKPFPKSTGREYFNLDWLTPFVSEGEFSPNDIQCTLAELTAKTIADAIKKFSAEPRYQIPNTIFLCGGGAKNIFLVERIQKNCSNCTIKSTSEVGIDPQWIECAAFAWLAKQTLTHNTSNLISVTGASQNCILGGIYA